MAKALVIGSGMAGLGAALFLRRLGHEVVVFEKSPRPAPLVRGFTRQGLHFETGFHYAGGLTAGVLKRYLDALGVGAALHPRPLDTVGGEMLRFGDGAGDYPIARGRDAFIHSLAAAFPGTGPALKAFFARTSRYAKQSSYIGLSGEPFDPYGTFGDTCTLADFLDELALPIRVKTILSYRCILYGVHPSEALLREFALVNDAYLDDAATLKGGGAALVEAFEHELARQGAEVRTCSEVTAVELDDKQAVRAVTARCGERSYTVSGEMCIYCGAPAALPGLLPGGSLRPVYANKLLNLKETSNPFIMFCSTSSGFFENRQLFYCANESVDNWFPGQPGYLEGGENRNLYISGGEANGGRYPMVVVIAMPHAAVFRRRQETAGADYAAFKAATAASLRSHALGVFPELNGDLEIVDSATDHTIRHWSFGSSGSLYGRLHSLDAPVILPATRIPGLALAGQNIVLPGILGALVSAAVAVGTLLGQENVLEVLA